MSVVLAELDVLIKASSVYMFTESQNNVYVIGYFFTSFIFKDFLISL